MFLRVSVILFTGGSSKQTPPPPPLGRPPWWAYPPGRQTPLAGRYPPRQADRHPRQADTSPRQADTSPRQADTPPPRGLTLQRTVRILLECILVLLVLPWNRRLLHRVAIRHRRLHTREHRAAWVHYHTTLQIQCNVCSTGWAMRYKTNIPYHSTLSSYFFRQAR